jgi:hypothetical protein
MTPAAQQPPQEYIITDEEMIWACNGGLTTEEEERIRSRPHTPARDPSIDCFWKCEHGKRLQEEAVRAATLAENKRVLSGLIDLASNYFETLEDGGFRGLPLTSDVEAIPPSKLLVWCESLRSTADE